MANAPHQARRQHRIKSPHSRFQVRLVQTVLSQAINSDQSLLHRQRLTLDNRASLQAIETQGITG